MRFLVILLLVILNSPVIAQPLLNLGENETFVIDDFVYAFADAQNRYPEPDWTDLSFKEKFVRQTDENPIFDVDRGRLWLSFEVANQSRSRAWILMVPRLLDRVRLYKLEHQTLSLISEAGTLVDFADRDLQRNGFYMDLDLSPGDTARYLLSIENDLKIRYDITLGSLAGILKDVHNTRQIFFVLIGVLIMLLAYNIGLTITTRSYANLLFSIHLLVYIGVTLFNTGYIMEFAAWANWFEIHNAFFTSLFGILLVLSIVELTNMKEHVPFMFKMHYLLLGLLALFGLLNLLGFYRFSRTWVENTIFVGAVWIVSAMIQMRQNQNREYQFVLFAVLIFIAGGVFEVLNSKNVLPVSVKFVNYSFLTASIIEITLITIAFSVKLQDQIERNREKLQQNIRRLGIRNHFIRQFSHVTAHKLTHPVSNLNGLTSAFSAGLIEDEDVREMSHRIRAEVNNLQGYVNDLTGVIKLQEHQQQYVSRVRFEEILQESKLALHREIDRSGAGISTRFLLPEIEAVAPFILSTFIHLIENSIRYRRPNAAPDIRISAEEQDGFCVLTFIDNGLGIDMERYGKKVFDLYSKFHRQKSGKGIGLFLVKTQVEASGGTIELNSELNIGTTVSIKLPLWQQMQSDSIFQYGSSHNLHR